MDKIFDDLKAEIKSLSEEASLRYAKKGVYAINYHKNCDNASEREHYSYFNDGFREAIGFILWLKDVSFTQSDIPLHIKYRMYKNQTSSCK